MFIFWLSSFSLLLCRCKSYFHCDNQCLNNHHHHQHDQHHNHNQHHCSYDDDDYDDESRLDCQRRARRNNCLRVPSLSPLHIIAVIIIGIVIIIIIFMIGIIIIVIIISCVD